MVHLNANHHKQNAPPSGTSFELIWRQQLGGSIISVSATPNCSLIAAGSVDRTVSVFSFSGLLQWRRRLDFEVWATSISANGSRIAVGTADKYPAAGTIYIFDRDGNQLWHFKVDAPVWQVSLSGDGTMLAAGSWNNNAYVFTEVNGSWKEFANRSLGSSGVYGVSVDFSGQNVLIAAYGDGAYFCSNSLDVIRKFSDDRCGYRAHLAPDGSLGIVGMREGRAMLIGEASEEFRVTPKLSQRPMCGVSITPCGTIIALGSFDGRVYIGNHKGELLWSTMTQGEIWSLALSNDATLLCVGSGDASLYFIRNHSNSAAIAELEGLEKPLSSALQWQEKRVLSRSLVEAYLRYGLVNYGARRLLGWANADYLGDDIGTEAASQLLNSDIRANPDHSESYFQLASILEANRDWWNAGIHYITASQEPSLRLQGFVRAAECFMKANESAAAMSCFRRMREQYLNDQSKMVLYNLGRSFEDVGNVSAAKTHYGVLLTWDPFYRDVAQRLRALDRGAAVYPSQAETDYTGLTVNLLSADTPRMAAVDPRMFPILEARSKERGVDSHERDGFNSVLNEYGADVLEKRGNVLEYDLAMYIKYDFLLPEDELKKRLELINFLVTLREVKPINQSLDIGAATGRYPAELASRGVEAYGVDLEPEAMNYAASKKLESQFPVFLVGGAEQLPFTGSSFDLVTCMMGTFAHIPRRSHEAVFSEIKRVLRPNGTIVLSTWDLDCPHLTFLSMYSVAQKEEISRNSLRKPEIQNLLERLGFKVGPIRPICMIPDVFSYELGVQGLGKGEVRHLVDIDLATRAYFPENHGQMYMVVARIADD